MAARDRATSERDLNAAPGRDAAKTRDEGGPSYVPDADIIRLDRKLTGELQGLVASPTTAKTQEVVATAALVIENIKRLIDQDELSGVLRADVRMAIELHERASVWILEHSIPRDGTVDAGTLSREVTRRMGVKIQNLVSDSADMPYPTRNRKRKTEGTSLRHAIYAIVSRDGAHVVAKFISTYNPFAYTNTPGALGILSAWLSAVRRDPDQEIGDENGYTPRLAHSPATVFDVVRALGEFTLAGNVNMETIKAIYRGCTVYMAGDRPGTIRDIAAHPRDYFTAMGTTDIDSPLVAREHMAIAPLFPEVADFEQILSCALLAYRQGDAVFADIIYALILHTTEAPITVRVPVSAQLVVRDALARGLEKAIEARKDEYWTIITNAGAVEVVPRLGLTKDNLAKEVGKALVSSFVLVGGAVLLASYDWSQVINLGIRAIAAPGAIAAFLALLVDLLPKDRPEEPPVVVEERLMRDTWKHTERTVTDLLEKLEEHDARLEADVERVLDPLYMHLEELDHWPGRGRPPKDGTELALAHGKLTLHDHLVVAAKRIQQTTRPSPEMQQRLADAIRVADEFRVWLEQTVTSQTYL